MVVVTGVESPRQLHALEMSAGAMPARGSLFVVDLLVVVAAFVVDLLVVVVPFVVDLMVELVAFVVAGFRLKDLGLAATAVHCVTVWVLFPRHIVRTGLARV